VLRFGLWVCVSVHFVNFNGERNWGFCDYSVDDPGGIHTPLFKDLCQYGRFLLVSYFLEYFICYLSIDCCGPL